MPVKVSAWDLSYSRQLGARLAHVRKSQGLSLKTVEAESAGRFKKSALGAYERGDRPMPVVKLYELARFYRVPILDLMPATAGDHHVTEAMFRSVDAHAERIRRVNRPR